MSFRSRLRLPFIENLEDRCLLAGNISVTLGQVALVSGDGQGNSLEISPGATPNDIIFRGLDGTTVNGSAEPFIGQLTGGLKSLEANLGGGDDLLVITNLSEGATNWPMATVPQVASNFMIGGSLQVLGSSGNDSILLRHVDVGTSLLINTADGSDVLVLESTNIKGKVTILTGDGDDQILARTVTANGKTSVNTGAGNDSVGLFDVVLRKHKINLGSNDDTVWIEGTQFMEGVRINGKSGNNQLTEHYTEHNTIKGKAKPVGFSQDLELTSAVHFGYEEEIGPDHWGSLTPAFLLAQVGRQQTPINIDTTALVAADLPDIGISYVDNLNLPFIHNGHTIQVNFPVGNSIEVAGSTYDLLQFHFHAHSEHTVDGVSSPLELHLVHRDAAGNLLVLGVLIGEGLANAAYDPLIASLPNHDEPSKVLAGPFNPLTLLPTIQQYYAYLGSLTTPPASEGVSFAIFTTIINLSATQIESITSALGEHNARPVQPVNDRTVFVDIA